MRDILVRAVEGALILIVSVLINGVLISAMWGWFVAPVLRLQNISIPEAIGLSMFVSIFTNRPKPFKRSDGVTHEEAVADLIGYFLEVGVMTPLFGLALAWVWHAMLIAQR